MRKIEYCHGATWKLKEVYSRNNIDLFKNCGCNAIELNCHSIKDAEKLEGIAEYIKGFEYISMHLPCDLQYKNNNQTKELLKKLEDFYIKYGAKLAVVHPDLVDDWIVFDSYPLINWAIENMDDRKAKFKGVGDLRVFFNGHQKWNLVLDLGHCNANDKSMLLAEDLIGEFKNSIKEIHLSGYETFHDPLYRTKQVEIIKYCKELEVPIIIESTFEKLDGIEGVAKEFDFIVENL